MIVSLEVVATCFILRLELFILDTILKLIQPNNIIMGFSQK